MYYQGLCCNGIGLLRVGGQAVWKGARQGTIDFETIEL